MGDSPSPYDLNAHNFNVLSPEQRKIYRLQREVSELRDKVVALERRLTRFYISSQEDGDA